MTILSTVIKSAPYALSLCAAALISACGGGGETSATMTPSQDVAPMVNATTTFVMDTAILPESAAAMLALPSFRMAPALLAVPEQSDGARAARHVHRRLVDGELAQLSNRRLTVDMLRRAGARTPDADLTLNADEAITPMAGTTLVSTYTPAQIRAAYGMTALPAPGQALSAAQAAQLGAGQTIYIVDAMHDANLLAELAAFNQKFGLPACSSKLITPSTVLPLAAAGTTGCELAVVYTNASGVRSSTPPAVDAGWATEITLDVQWAHATAPLARIILIEAADASLNSLLGAIKLANAMGPGVVSMSFGANEGSWTASVDSAFTAAGMTYLAATGDSGAAVSWPAVSPNVVAVGGTSLTYSGSGARSEVGWSGTGGGISAYVPTPAYQTNAVPGLGTVARRSVADVAFNADPSTGQYVAVQGQGSAAVSWVSAGGTSLSTPQWAGLIAVANATRAQAARPALGAPHAVLYGQIGAVPGNYASAFADIIKGSDGSCAGCSAKLGYDTLSGLGTPNVNSLISVLSGVTAAAPPPVVTAAGIAGTAGVPLAFTVSASGPNPLTYLLSGAPAGMSIGATGIVNWAAPIVGTYPVGVIAKDSKSGLSGQATYTVTISAPAPPQIAAAAVSGNVGTALGFQVAVTAVNPVTYALSGAPAGMTISTTGGVSWPAPVAGTYKVTVSARDSKTGLTGQGIITVAIAAPLPPVVSAATITGKPGTALSYAVGVVAPNAVSFSLVGAPVGMSIGSNGVLVWANPVLGNYAVTVVAKDGKTGLSGQGVLTLKIAAAGPVISAAPMTGVAGKALSGAVTITDPGATSLSISISGVPLGMGFSINGLTLTANWPSPVVGVYNLTVVVTDSAGLSAKLVVPVTVTAK
ncbi:hypothetical protein RCH09_001162 [Actimicrobium sp. GrIS 1.19]|uniref:S53 family peptidase n=1 Tax=Actimicrobium sp. GrIS 1.19 TaxID=3071708 RepID=UPI002E0AE6AE|nr:hypothetical protein [Actimicrobium sp. GrIS 1.19]